MAYQVDKDYSAANTELKKQLAAATDAATKAALQAQINANQASREQKIASDLTKFGKYASDTELNNAAGIISTNQLGTGYDVQRANLNTSFDQAKQNANNDALSRGMARSTFVSDRMANLDTSRAKALSGVDASQALALQNAKTSIIDNYRTNTANALANEKKEFANTIGAYYNDFQQEINNVQGNNDPSDDWKIPYLQAARNEKIAAQEAAALKAAKTYSSGGTYRDNGGGDAVDDGVVDGSPWDKPTTPRTATYGNSTISEVNDRLNAGYTPQEVLAAAKEKYGVNSKEYQSIVSAVLRQR